MGGNQRLREQMIQMIQSEGKEPTEEEIMNRLELLQAQKEEPGLIETDPTDFSPKGMFKGVTSMLGKKGLRKVDPDTFNQAIKGASKKNPHISKMLSDHPRDQLSKMKKYVDPKTGSGFAVKPDGDITNVFSATKGQGSRLIKEAKRKGGTKLDHFDSGPLSKTYGKAGFKEVRREPNWTPGGPDVVFREASEGPSLLDRIKSAVQKSNVKVQDLDNTGSEIFDKTTAARKIRELKRLRGE